MSARLLFLADLHLGRRPLHVPGDLVEHGVSPSELTPLAAWRAAVARAVELRVDGVVLGGDVVEADNARFEAFGPLEDGVRALVAAGIPVWAVAGNHDVEALPRLADRIDGFHLLGRGGCWETVEGASSSTEVIWQTHSSPAASIAISRRRAGWASPLADSTRSSMGTEPLPIRRFGMSRIIWPLPVALPPPGVGPPRARMALPRCFEAGPCGICSAGPSGVAP